MQVILFKKMQVILNDFQWSTCSTVLAHQGNSSLLTCLTYTFVSFHSVYRFEQLMALKRVHSC